MEIKRLGLLVIILALGLMACGTTDKAKHRKVDPKCDTCPHF